MLDSREEEVLLRRIRTPDSGGRHARDTDGEGVEMIKAQQPHILQ